MEVDLRPQKEIRNTRRFLLASATRRSAHKCGIIAAPGLRQYRGNHKCVVDFPFLSLRIIIVVSFDQAISLLTLRCTYYCRKSTDHLSLLLYTRARADTPLLFTLHYSIV